MPETKPRASAHISEALMLARLAQSEQMRVMLSPLDAVPPAPTFSQAESTSLYFDV